jgi:protein SCO1/2
MNVIIFPLRLATATLLVMGAACGCKPATKPDAQPSTSTINTNTAVKTNFYYVKGMLKSIKPNGHTAEIAHEEIPNFMPKMTMPLDVADPKELKGLAPGDQLHFRMVVTPDELWIDQVTKVGTSAMTNDPSTAGRKFRQVREVEPLKVGEVMPNYNFTNELGKAMSLADLKGNAYAFTFIFTVCPMPQFCPRLSEYFSKAHEQLAAPGGPDNWRLLSISFDVERDTPAVLKNYAARFSHDPARWSFLTGALIDIDAITEQFGLYFARDANGITFDHNLRTVIVDPKGRINSIIIGNEWKVEDFVAEMKRAAAK